MTAPMNRQSGHCKDQRITTGPPWWADRHGGHDIR
jgi:hypothetical protein